MPGAGSGHRSGNVSDHFDLLSNALTGGSAFIVAAFPRPKLTRVVASVLACLVVFVKFLNTVAQLVATFAIPMS